MNTDQGLLCLEKKVYQLWQDMADAKLGWSNKGVKGNVVESVTGNIETRVVVRLMY